MSKIVNEALKVQALAWTLKATGKAIGPDGVHKIWS